MEADEKLTTANAKREEGNAFFKQGRCDHQQNIAAPAHPAAWSQLSAQLAVTAEEQSISEGCLLHPCASHVDGSSLANHHGWHHMSRQAP